ncbi:MAG: GyrI-like domain-containing protein [Candidatus Hodarchaeota archaeon]
MNIKIEVNLLIRSNSIEKSKNYFFFIETRNYFVLVGVEVDNVEEVPLEMFAKILSKTKYVFFTTTMENKFERGGYIYKKWLPENNYEQAFPYVIQLYDNRRYKGLEDPNSEIDWFIPIKNV